MQFIKTTTIRDFFDAGRIIKQTRETVESDRDLSNEYTVSDPMGFETHIKIERA